MEIKDNPTSICFYRPDVTKVDTTKIFKFEIQVVHEKETYALLVSSDKSDSIFENLIFYTDDPTKSLFKKFTNTEIESFIIKTFDSMYNIILQYLNLDFEPLTIKDTVYNLSEQEQDYLTQQIILKLSYLNQSKENWADWITNSFNPIEEEIMDVMVDFLDQKYGSVDTDYSIRLTVGAKILRQDYQSYIAQIATRKARIDGLNSRTSYEDYH